MTILIIILAYVANVFLNRWLNKLLIKINNDLDPIPFVWFLSVLGTVLSLCAITLQWFYKTDKSSKFWGNHWKK